MRASLRLYGIAHELKNFKNRTYHFAISVLGYSLKGYRGCPSEIIISALKHVQFVKLTVEIDLDQLVELSYIKTFVMACRDAVLCLRHLNGTEKCLETYDVDIVIVDSKCVPGEALSSRKYFSRRHI